MKDSTQAPEKAAPPQQHVTGPSQQYVYDASQQQYVYDASQQQQVYDSSQAYTHFPSQQHLLDPLQQHPAPAYSAESPQPPVLQGYNYNNYASPYPPGPGAPPGADKPSQAFDAIQQGQHPAQTGTPGAAVGVKRGVGRLLAKPRKWSLKKKLIAGAIVVVILVLVIAVPAGVLLNRKRRCQCPAWYDRKNVYVPATYYPCDSKGKDLNTNLMPSCKWETAGYY